MDHGTRAVRDYRDLIVWQRAMELVEAVYTASHSFPPYEIYGLTSQLRRSAISVPSNIAEGNGRRTRKEYIAFLYVARASLAELRTQIELARRLQYVGNWAHVDGMANEVNSMLNAMLATLRKMRDV